MIRSYSSLIACLALSVACTSKSSPESENPDAGQYDGYYSENGDGTATGDDGQDQGTTTTTPTGPRPKARASTGTRGGAKKIGTNLRLVAKKPVVSGEKPRVVPTDLKAEFAVAGMFPTSAAVGSHVEIFGSGFPEDMTGINVFAGGKRLKVIEASADRIVAEVTAAGSGPIEVGKGTARMNKKGRAKSNGTFVATAADGAFNQPRTRVGHGLLGRVFEVDPATTEVPNFNDLGAPLALIAVDDLDIPAGEAPAGVAGRGQSFGIHFQGSLNIVEAGEYEICLTAGDGALLFLDQTPVIENDGSGAAREKCETLYVEPGEYGLDLLYYQGADADLGLTLSWAKDGGTRAPIPADAFFPPENLYDLAATFDQGG